MESLLCNEKWAMSPCIQEDDYDCVIATSFLWMRREDCEEAITTFLGKERRYLPESSYFKLVGTNDLIGGARFRAVTWIIKSQRRMDLCLETVFGAVNYLDRFISMTRCQGWKCWMFELLTIACLSIATKFFEATAYSLHDLQEDLETWFAPSLIQRMEITVLKALDWRVDSITPFSYIHLLLTHACNKTLVDQLTKRVTHLLLYALSVPRFLEFSQYVMAISAVRIAIRDLYTSEQDYPNLEALIPRHHKDDFIRCMEKLMVQNGSSCGSPSSPVTVLKVHLFSSFEFRDANLATYIDLTWSRKRKRKRDDTEVFSPLSRT